MKSRQRSNKDRTNLETAAQPQAPAPRPDLPAAVGELVCAAVPGGVEFDVHATPGAARAGIRGLHGSALKVALRSPPEKGRANAELLELLAEALGLPTRQCSLVRGGSSRTKRVRVVGCTAAQLRALARPGAAGQAGIWRK